MRIPLPPAAKPLPRSWEKGLSARAVAQVKLVEQKGPKAMPAAHSKGYIRIYLGRSHPYATSDGCQLLHRYIMMRHLGRVLGSFEHVHHRNGDKETTEIQELEIMEDVDHGHFHYGKRLGCGREFLTNEGGKELPTPENPEPYYHPGHTD